MAFLKWTENYSVAVNEIDDQHQILFSYLNELYDAMKDGKGNIILEKVLSKLLDYTNTHFSNEERYMAKLNYPLINSHKIEHKYFIDEVVKFKTSVTSGNTTVPIKLGQFLIDWFKNHIMKVDKKLGAFLNENGIK